jgi:hypothetical protein
MYAFFHALTLSLFPKNHMLFIVSKQCAYSRRVHIEGHMNRFEFLLSWTIIPIRTLTDSERKMNRSEVSSKWNKCRIYVGDQLYRWSELKEVLRVQTLAEVAKILLDR